MPAQRTCAICNWILKPPAPSAMVEVRMTRGGGPRLSRSVVCGECGEWIRTYARTRPVGTSGGPDLPDDPPLRMVTR